MFEVGQIVICIDGAPPRFGADQILVLPKAGERYTVRGTHFLDGVEGFGVYLKEIVNPSIIWSDGDEFEMSFDCRRFKPYDGLLRPVSKARFEIARSGK